MPDQYGNPTQADVDAYLAQHYTPAQRQRITGVQAAPAAAGPGAPPPAAAPPPATSNSPGSSYMDWLSAVGGGGLKTLRNTLTDVGQLSGWQAPQNWAQSQFLASSPEQQAAMAAHPYLTGAGEIGAGVLETAPFLAGGEIGLGAGAEALGARALATRVAPWLMRQPTAIRMAAPIAKYMGRSALGGSLAQTATGDPNESPESRALWGGVEGAATGLPFGYVDALAGGGASIGSDVVKQAMKQSRLFAKGGKPAGMPAAVNYVQTAPAYAPAAAATTSLPSRAWQWIMQHPVQAMGYGGAGYEALQHYLPNMDPAAALGVPTMIGAGTWLGGQLGAGARGLSNMYLKSAPYIEQTLQRGGAPAQWHSMVPYFTGAATPKAYPPTPPY